MRDGVLLLHKDGAYAAGVTSPLALLWKDAGCSRHPVDTDASGAVPPLQVRSSYEWRTTQMLHFRRLVSAPRVPWIAAAAGPRGE